MALNLRYRPTPDNAPLLAGDVVVAAREISGVFLDYSIASLYQVDRILAGLHAEGVETREVAETLFGFGCYVGEVFVRCAQGEWWNAANTSMEHDAGFPLVIRLPTGVFCNPIGKVFQQLELGGDDSLISFFQSFSEPL